MDEYAYGFTAENTHYGPTRNPHNPSRVPGGSSGGSAAAVAAGFAPLSLGTDTGGSIRQPAALCGIVGLKPTYGAVSRFGMIAFASSLDQAGPLTRDVTDSALIFRHMVGHDDRDATSVAFPEEVVLPTAQRLDGIRLGVPDDLTGEGVEPGVMERFEATLDVARDLGASVERVSLAHADYGLSAYYVLAPAEASSNLARYDGVRYGLRVHGADSVEMMTRTRGAGFGGEVKRRIMLGTYALSAGYYEAYYGQAQKVRTLIIRDYEAAFEAFDVLVSPTSPTTAFPIGAKVDDPLAMYLNDVFTIPANLSGVPAISIPSGVDEAGLPVGLQLTAPVLAEPTLLRVANALEAALGFDARPALIAA